MVNIVCLKWGTKYGPDYVNKLYASIYKNSRTPFRFHCFTDDCTGIRGEVICHELPFKDKLEGWWNKLFLFSNDINIPVGDTIFYVDLDTVICGNVDELLKLRVPVITLLKDFYHGIAKTAAEVGSGLMMWEHGKYTHVWEEFVKDPDLAMRRCVPHNGDQQWVSITCPQRLLWQDLYPGKVVSFKQDCYNGPPPGASIICFHGKPSIPEATQSSGTSWKYSWKRSPWLHNYWQE